MIKEIRKIYYITNSKTAVLTTGIENKPDYKIKREGSINGSFTM